MPYMMVQSSKTCRAKLDKNNLSPAEFLQPFGEIGSLNGMQIRTSDKNEAVKLHKFRVNFVDSNQLNPDPRQAQKVVDMMFQECSPSAQNKAKSPSNHTRQQAEEELAQKLSRSRKATEESETPWFTNWKKSFFSQNRFQTYELTEQPVGFVFMLTVDDDDPVGISDAMRDPKNLPPHYNKLGLYDFNNSIPRSFVFILNDRNDSGRV